MFEKGKVFQQKADGRVAVVAEVHGRFGQLRFIDGGGTDWVDWDPERFREYEHPPRKQG